jgi:hypothetical protein
MFIVYWNQTSVRPRDTEVESYSKECYYHDIVGLLSTLLAYHLNCTCVLHLHHIKSKS